jgi:hypothetical protein
MNKPNRAINININSDPDSPRVFEKQDLDFSLNESYATHAELNPPSSYDIKMENFCYLCGVKFGYYRFFYDNKLFCRTCYTRIKHREAEIEKFKTTR